MPGFMDRMKAAGEHIKRPTQTKPESKGFIRAANKTFHCMLSCLKCQKDEDDCPGLPEVKTSYIDEEIPESHASWSYISLTDSESDGCPAEADLGSRSDSLEGIPEMLEAESLPSLLENNEEKEAADGEKDLSSHDPCPAEAEPNPAPASDGLPQPQVTNAVEAIPETLLVESLSSSTGSDAGPCPAEADPGPSSDRVPEPQGRTSDEERCVQESDMNNSNCSMTEDDIHLMCDIFNTSSKEKKRSLADGIASKRMDLMLEHFLKSEETACDKLMYAVFASPKCSLGMCLDEFIVTLSENQIQDSEELPLAKLKALRGIRAIVRDHGDIKILNDWLSCHFVALTNILVSYFEPKKQGTSRKPKMYLVPGEAIDIFAILLQRLNLMHKMMSVFNPR